MVDLLASSMVAIMVARVSSSYQGVQWLPGCPVVARVSSGCQTPIKWLDCLFVVFMCVVCLCYKCLCFSFVFV